MRATGLLTELSLSPLESADTARLAEAMAGRSLAAHGPRSAAGHDRRLSAVRHRGGTHVDRSRRASRAAGRAHRGPAEPARASQRRRLARSPGSPPLSVAISTSIYSPKPATSSADDVVRAVDELWRRRILHEWRDGYDFSHDLLRETAYEQVSPPRRWLLHRRLAQGLELLHADDIDAVSAQLAEQYARGGRPSGRSRTTQGGRGGVSMFAHIEAIRLLDELWRSSARSPRAGIATARSSRSWRQWPLRCSPDSVTRLQELQAAWNARGVAEELGRKDSIIEALFGLWTSRFVQGRIVDCERDRAPFPSSWRPRSEQAGLGALCRRRCTPALGTADRSDRTLRSGCEAHQRRGTPGPSARARTCTGKRVRLMPNGSSAAATTLGDRASASSWRARSTSRTAWRSRWPTPRSPNQMCGNTSELATTVDGALRALCERYDFAYYREWALILERVVAPGESGLSQIRAASTT